jgi:hypothetical protein
LRLGNELPKFGPLLFNTFQFMPELLHLASKQAEVSVKLRAPSAGGLIPLAFPNKGLAKLSHSPSTEYLDATKYTSPNMPAYGSDGEFELLASYGFTRFPSRS